MNRRSNFLTALFFLFFSISAAGQTPQSTLPPPIDDDDVVKISTDLVQVDAVVMDSKGDPVTNLTAGDFEIFQDGKRQKITNFTFVNTELPRKARSGTNKAKAAKDLVEPPVQVNSSVPGRVLTFVVDDGNCDVTHAGMIAAREGLEKFVSEQMQPNDRVAIYQTRSGSSLLQQYTSDREMLLKTIRKIRWYPPGGICSNNGEE
ncbi:MAG: VWA domain-containing protein, partial [Acidobacteria bacterium]|nr:VWA domain-containing protein [Acidobacteriota bacterium]